MAALDEANRARAWAEFMREESADRQPVALTKDDLRAAFNSIDAWADASAGNINAALPLPARTALTVRQKAKLLAMVLQRRFGVSA